MYSAYIHIPFCRRRCFYCDFPITVLGDSATYKVSPWIEEYVDVLCREISLTPKLKDVNLETIFFGGGTPSLLPAPELARIINHLSHHFGISKKAEISMEIDPATFDVLKLIEYKNIGINRVSLGAQAFQDHLLEKCGRSHSVKDIFTAVDLIDKANINNFSMDLISGLPYQTIQEWEYSLKNVIKLKPKHISCYDLVLEPITVFGKKYQAGDKPLPTDEIAADMYRLASQMLRNAGYSHYEISNYAKSGYECRHNQVYWHNKPYYGFGMGAASYTQQKRFTRPRDRKNYFIWVENLAKNKGVIEAEILTRKDILLETLMLGLRLAKGVNLENISSSFGEEITQKIVNCVKVYVDKNWVSLDEDHSYLRLSDPEGFLYSNVILSDLFSLNLFDD